MTCWICAEYERCPFPVCQEQEVADRVKQEAEAQAELFEDEDE